MKSRKLWLSLLLGVLVMGICACGESLRRGMLGNAYISTARPAISIEARNMPLMEAGQGLCNLFWSGMAGGLTIQMWIAVYGEGGLAPLAVTAQAQTPSGWFWDGIMRQPGSVDEASVNFNGVNYQACTFIVNPAKDPFGNFVTGVKPDGQPQLWVARYFAARYNFDDDKIILRYMEPLPDAIVNLSEMPLGYGNFLAEFAARAQNAFIVANVPSDLGEVRKSYVQGVNWQYMGERFLGTVSKNITFSMDK